MKEESELMPMNYPNSVPSQVPYRTAAPLTNQVPNLSAMPGVNQDERWGFLPFIGGLALGGLLFDGWGGGRPCCGGGGYAYPVYQPVYQPVYYQQPVYTQPILSQFTNNKLHKLDIMDLIIQSCRLKQPY